MARSSFQILEEMRYRDLMRQINPPFLWEVKPCRYCGEIVQFNFAPYARNFNGFHEQCFAAWEVEEAQRTKHLLPCPFKRRGPYANR